MKIYKQLLLSNKAWATELKEENQAFFDRLSSGQRPDFLWIGCADSRVGPEQITMTPPGGLFTHRNVANLVYADDTSLLAVLEYAVNVLKVRHIILCGHYGCGGIEAALAGGTTGAIHDWLAGARAVADAHPQEMGAVADGRERINRLTELNVRDQLLKLAALPVVADAHRVGQELALHGWVYDLREGLIKPLLEIDGQTELAEVGTPERVLG